MRTPSGPIRIPTRSGVVVFATWDGDRDALLRSAAASALGSRTVELDAEECPDCGRHHGAPFARAGARCAVLSLAHSGPASIAAASTDARVGIDALPHDTDPASLGRILDDPDPVRHWTRIEAVLKADGRGLRVDADRIRFSPDRTEAQLDGRIYALEELLVDGIVVTLAAAGAPAVAG